MKQCFFIILLIILNSYDAKAGDEQVSLKDLPVVTNAKKPAHNKELLTYEKVGTLTPKQKKTYVGCRNFLNDDTRREFWTMPVDYRDKWLFSYCRPEEIKKTIQAEDEKRDALENQSKEGEKTPINISSQSNLPVAPVQKIKILTTGADSDNSETQILINDVITAKIKELDIKKYSVELTNVKLDDCPVECQLDKLRGQNNYAAILTKPSETAFKLTLYNVETGQLLKTAWAVNDNNTEQLINNMTNAVQQIKTTIESESIQEKTFAKLPDISPVLPPQPSPPVNNYEGTTINFEASRKVPPQPSPGHGAVAAGWVMFTTGVVLEGIITLAKYNNDNSVYTGIQIGLDVFAITGLFIAIAGHSKNAKARRHWQLEYSK